MLLNAFVNPAKQMAAPETLYSIFGNVEQITGINRLMLSQLEERVKAYSHASMSPRNASDITPSSSDTYAPVLIGDILLDFTSQLKHFHLYCLNQENALVALEHLRNDNKAFDELLTKKEYTPECNNLNMASFLVKPLARINKYPSLMREIVRSTSGMPGEDDEVAKLEQALQALEQCAATVVDARFVCARARACGGCLDAVRRVGVP